MPGKPPGPGSGWQPLGDRAPNVDRGPEFIEWLKARYMAARKAMDDEGPASVEGAFKIAARRRKKTKDEKYARVEREIRKLPIRRGQKWRVPWLARDLVEMTAASPEPHLRPANTATVDKQLVELRTRASRLARTIDCGARTNRARRQLALLIRGLFEDTIRALSEAPWLTVAGEPAPFNMAWFRILPAALERGDPISAEALCIAARVAEAAINAQPKGTGAGAPPDRHSQAVADVLTKAYADLTGRQPTFTHHGAGTKDKDAVSGPFAEFARDMFAMLGMRPDASYYVARAAHARRGKGRKK